MSFSAVRWAALALAAPLVGPTAARADEITVFAAASLTDVLQEAAKSFEAASAHRVVFNFGGSNDLGRQIKAGAPADLFFSADKAQMDEVARDGHLAGMGDRIDVLSNTLVVVVPAGSSTKVSGPADLKALARIVLANPEAVPAGVYARKYLEAEGAWDAVKDKVVPTLDVRAALAAVEAEHADAAIVYRTDAARSKRVRVAFEVPRGKGARIVYPLGLLAGAKPAAVLFRDYLVSDAARALYEKHGFAVILDE
ncbi:MAG TPA: molybdate ABC transporter substrate-binding protein [Vicinamibacteria bacterium]|nr:molybdate ABC transporter substrate-binding protein [Vicinamibacteria bacterium]